MGRDWSEAIRFYWLVLRRASRETFSLDHLWQWIAFAVGAVVLASGTDRSAWAAEMTTEAAFAIGIGVTLLLRFLGNLLLAPARIHREDMTAEIAERESAEAKRDAALNDVEVLKGKSPILTARYECNRKPYDRWIEGGGKKETGVIGHFLVLHNDNPVPVHHLKLEIVSMFFAFGGGRVDGNFPCTLVEGKHLTIGDQAEFLFLRSRMNGGRFQGVDSDCITGSVDTELFVEDGKGNTLDFKDHLRVNLRVTSADSDPMQFAILMSENEIGYPEGHLTMLPHEEPETEERSLW